MRAIGPRLPLLLVAALAVAGLLGLRTVIAGGAPARAARTTHSVRPSAARLPDGSLAKFRFLSRQTSNRCDLEPSALMAMPNSARLQGSCCSAMDRAAYQSQVHGLRAYVSIDAIPPDPYDIAVPLAKRLIAYDRAIHLTPAQTRSYRQAMRMSHEGAPCCCPCWRWTAFRGLSKHLLADLRWRPRQVARVIDLVEGCGGPASS